MIDINTVINVFVFYIMCLWIFIAYLIARIYSLEKRVDS